MTHPRTVTVERTFEVPEVWYALVEDTTNIMRAMFMFKCDAEEFQNGPTAKHHRTHIEVVKL